jgi:hypothetical protein
MKEGRERGRERGREGGLEEEGGLYDSPTHFGGGPKQVYICTHATYDHKIREVQCV